jgi:catechol 2,3-dioxygenase-like lactoylglutathione lyase family enzyme
MTRLLQLFIADEPTRWQALGLHGCVDTEGRWCCTAGPVGVIVDPGLEPTRAGIVAWGLDTPVDSVPELGVRFVQTPGLCDVGDHRLVGIDHVVLMTASLEQTCELIADRLGAPLKRVRDAGGGVRQGFHRLGDVIVEVVQAPGVAVGPAQCWGLVFTVTDLDELVGSWSDDVVSRPRDAVQPGRRIASLRRGAGLATAVAFMTPELRVP